MWLFEEQTFDPTPEALATWVGFVYEVNDTANGKKYIGKKGFWSTRRLQPLKGKKRKRVVKKESDWKTYYGSNEEIKLLVEASDPERWERRILRLCTSKGEMSYYEAKEQIERNVLFDDSYYNEFIGLKIHAKHVGHLKEKFIDERDKETE